MRLTLITALVVLVIDQITKLAVVHGLNLKDRGEIDVFSPYLNFRMAWNEGINFGLLSRQDDLMRWILIAIAIAISLAVLWWIFSTCPAAGSRTLMLSTSPILQYSSARRRWC
jgi:signal peptidase II